MVEQVYYVIKYNVLLISLYKFGLVASYVVNPSFQNWKVVSEWNVIVALKY